MAADYCGRFAPSPTGDLHFGSLVAAIASYCQAKSHGGQWLIRIEDVDETRVIPGADKLIIETLRLFGMVSDQPIMYQTESARQSAYQAALKQLDQAELTYPCICTRKQMQGSLIYSGRCRNKSINCKKPHTIRITVNAQDFTFIDLFQGSQTQTLSHQCGDFIIKRKDGLIAYQLAVVVDDADQGISEVVRGIDIMESTGRQMYLNQLLNLNQPSYAHFPIITNGDKLSKQNHAKAITHEDPYTCTLLALKALNQDIPVLKVKSQTELLKFAISHWQTEKLKNMTSVQY